MLTRRTLLTGLGAIIAAPAIVRASSLMPVKAWRTMPMLWGDGVHDDTAALQAFANGDVVMTFEGPMKAAELVAANRALPGGLYRITSTINLLPKEKSARHF